MADKAAEVERIRDLRAQVEGLKTEVLPEVQFMVIDTGRLPITIYAVEDGRPVTIPEYQLGGVLDKRLEDGRFMFVADKDKAPEYKMGEIVCFLHVDAPDRAVIEELGLGAIRCRKHTLPTSYAATIHGQHRHRQEWAAYQQHLAGAKEAKVDAERRQQLEATLSIARAAQGSPAVEAKAPQAIETDCPQCSWKQGPAIKNRRAALAAHARAKHTAGGE